MTTNENMKAIVFTEYRPPDVLQLKEVEKPTPKENEVLAKVHAASVNYSDWSSLRGKPFLVRLMGSGVLKPEINILGVDIAGRVEAVGANVNKFQPGDAIFGDIIECGWDGYAEYVCAPENLLSLKPATNAEVKISLVASHSRANTKLVLFCLVTAKTGSKSGTTSYHQNLLTCHPTRFVPRPHLIERLNQGIRSGHK